MKRVSWYFNKYGLGKTVQRICSKSWESINRKVFVYIKELNTLRTPEFSPLKNFLVEEFKSLNAIPKEYLDQLFLLKTKDIIVPYLEKFFARGATLYLAIWDNRVVGLEWVKLGGFNGFYEGFPVMMDMAALMAAETFPEYRGHGVNPSIVHSIEAKLKNAGIKYVCAVVHVKNTSSQRVYEKLDWQKIGAVRSFKLMGKEIVIWDRLILPSNSSR